MPDGGWDTARLALELRRRRDALALTQEDLADRSGLSVRTIRDLENGRVRAPRRSSLTLLARALGMEARGLDRFGPAAGTVPRALPVPPLPEVGLVGRDDLLAGLDPRLRGGGRLCLCGPPGVGKSTLAAALATTAGSRFDDVLWLDLRGFSRPRSTVDGLRALIAAAEDTARPTVDDEAALAARWVEVTRSRRLLVVLDNAADEAQVRPLLPAAGEAAVVITARVPLTVVEPSQIVVVGHLDTGAAGALFQAWVGADRALADDASVQDVVAACDGLPLAVQVAAARLASRPQWTARDLAARLVPDLGRLDQLRLGDLDVRAALAGAYDALPEPQQAALRRVAAVGTSQLPMWLISPLLDVGDRATAARRCDELVDAGLLHALGQPADAGDESFAVHDLVRILAAEQAWSPAHRDETRTAVRRAADTISDLAVAIDAGAVQQWASPGGPGWLATMAELAAPTVAGEDAMPRLDTDHGAVLAVLDRAVEHLPPDDVWRTVVALAWFWENTGRFSEWAEVTQRLLDQPDARAAAWATVAYTSLAGAHLARGDMAAAAAAYRHAVAGSGSEPARRYARLGVVIARSYAPSDDRAELRAELADVLAEARATNDTGTAVEAAINLARLLAEAGERLRAVQVLDDAATTDGLPAMPRARLRQNVADVLAAIGSPDALDRASLELEAARAVFAAHDLQVWVAAALRTAARVHQRAGRYTEALDALAQGRAIFERIGDERWVGYLFLASAGVRLEVGDTAAAAHELGEAEQRLRRVGDPRGLALVSELAADPRLAHERAD